MNQNYWMADYNFVCFMAHSCGALSLILLSGYLLGHPYPAFVAIALLVYAVVKEYWYDLVYELPKQTLSDSSLDFVGYLAGIIVGLTITLVAHRFMGK